MTATSNAICWVISLFWLLLINDDIEMGFKPKWLLNLCNNVLGILGKKYYLRSTLGVLEAQKWQVMAKFGCLGFLENNSLILLDLK